MSSRPHPPPPLPALAKTADFLTASLFLAGSAVLATGGGVWWIGPVRLSVRSPWRLFALTLIIAAIRHWYVRRPSIFAPLIRKAQGPLDLDEQQLFLPAASAGRRAAGLAGLTLAFAALVAVMTWPQAARLNSVPDAGDPLFSIWRISWVNHQILRDPLNLFNGNIYHPEQLTLTYSDSLVVPALMAAPLFWLGVHQLTIYNLLFLSGFVLSGVAMFLLVRALTGRSDAAAIASVIFALYPYRYEHYSHLELQMTMWSPLALWSLHRALQAGRLRDGILTGLFFALQMLSSLYYGVFLSFYMTVVGVAVWLGRGRPTRPIAPLAGGVVLAGLLIAPVASQYIASKPMMGDRDVGTIEFYSAVGSDYLKAHDRSWTYHDWSHNGNPERQIFPRIMPVLLTAIALWPPLSVARIAYAMVLALMVDGSFGYNGMIYPVLHDYLAPFRGLRVPARFAVYVGLTLSVLAGYGATRVLRRFPRQRWALTTAMVAVVIFEAIPRMPLEPVWREPPPIYAAIAGQPPAVLAEFPMPADGNESWFDTRYMYFSTWHWNRLVNGNSGFFPPSYFSLLEAQKSFPSDEAIGDLRARGVQYVTVHGAFYPDRGKFRRIVATLEARPDVELVAASPWERSESRLYRLR